MTQPNFPWFEIAVVGVIFALGHILFGHFEERTPKWRQIVKFFLALCLTIGVSAFAGRLAFWILVGLLLLPAVFIHGWWLPSKGINGWTGEPREKYFALRGWSATKKHQVGREEEP